MAEEATAVSETLNVATDSLREIVGQFRTGRQATDRAA
jgi:hypothetical protein